MPSYVKRNVPNVGSTTCVRRFLASYVYATAGDAGEAVERQRIDW
jgi:hypothetical protein